jgi:hypothetical protein
MSRLLLPVLVFFLTVSIPWSAATGIDYPDHNELTSRLRILAQDNPGYATLESIEVTDGGKEIWKLTIASDDQAGKPAIAVVGGVEGDHLLGTLMALRFAEMLLDRVDDDDIKKLLSEHTFYVFPDMSPDAREQYFSSLKFERKGNANISYTDRYGNKIIHPYKDLNGDGMISQMRIKDPAGEWIKHPDDERIMVKALISEGEKGEYSLYSEGLDIYKNERWTEQGVAFNRNFSFKFPFFTSGAGDHAISEPETRAIANFLFNANNIYAVISFGPANNLSEPLVYNEREASGRIITGIEEKDALVNQMVSKSYNGIAGNVAGKGVSGSDGDFFQWAWFHYGRFSFSTPGWSVPESKTEGSNSQHPANRRDNRELDFLRWTENENVEGVFIPWEKAVHPEFPELQVEVGGIAPFVIKNPPIRIAEQIAENHYRFIIEFANMRPVIDIVNVRTEEPGKNIYRVTATIVNTGLLPTVSAIGEKLRWVRKTVVRLETEEGQELISGSRVEVLPVIDGGGAESRSWLIRGKGNVRLTAGAESTGIKELIIKL